MTRSVPNELDDLEGLRAARWVRVSDDRQGDNYGPDAQRERQDRAIERYGLIDTGLAWEPLGVSGFQTDSEGIAKIEADPRYQDMLSRAGVDYDVLVIAYVSRGSRNTELQMKTRRTLHKAGAVILACKERMLSTEPGWGKEAADAEYYSEKLSIDISDGNAAKWRKHSDPPGHPGLGYRRASEKPYIREIDPDVIPEAVALYQRYALGSVSMDDLALDAPIVRYGRYKGRPMTSEGIADLLANPVYRGEVSYLGQTAQRPDLRAVSDDLWYQVQDVMRAKAGGGGPRRTDRVYPVVGLPHCLDCKAAIGLDGGDRNWRVRHKNPCVSWGPTRRTKRDPKGKRQERRKASTYSGPVLAAFSQINLDDETVANVRAIRTSPARMPDDLDARRIDRQMDEVVDQMRKGTLDRLEAVARLDTLRTAKDALSERPVTSHGPSPDEAEAMLRNFERTWGKAGEQERSDLIHALIARLDVRGAEIVGVTLTPSAYEHGFALALPEKVAMACPRGLEPPTFRSAT
jgi:DNA invertase Pin-like site-specific DNA recombinase